MLKKLVLALAAMLFTASVAFAGSLTTLTGPQDPSNLNNTINTLIISGNTNWSPSGANFLASKDISAIAAATISWPTAAGASGISPSTVISWLKVKGYINNTTTPTYFMIPMWGCPTCN